MENTFSGTTKGRDTRMMFKPKSKGAVLPRRAPERQDGFMRKKKMLKQTKRTAATHPRKRNSEYSMSLEERRARKLRLTRIQESAALLRAKKHDRNAINQALSKLTRTEEWIGSTSQEERIEMIRDERKYVFADRLSRGLSERALIMKFMRRRPVSERRQAWMLNVKEHLKEDELKKIEKMLTESEDYGLEYLERELQELQHYAIEDEDMEEEELNDLKELEMDEPEEPPVGKWETMLEKLDKQIQEPSKKELRGELRAEKLEKIRFEEQQKKDLRRLRLKRQLKRGLNEEELEVQRFQGNWEGTSTEDDTEDESEDQSEDQSGDQSEDESDDDLEDESECDVENDPKCVSNNYCKANWKENPWEDDGRDDSEDWAEDAVKEEVKEEEEESDPKSNFTSERNESRNEAEGNLALKKNGR